MKKFTKNELNIRLGALLLALTLGLLYLLGSTFAWFTDETTLIDDGVVATIEVQLLNASQQPLTAQSFIYSGATSIPLQVSVQLAEGATAINAIVRIIVVAEWTNNLPFFDQIQTLIYTYNEIDWRQSEAAGIGYDYLYYQYLAAPGQNISFLTQASFPLLHESYQGQTLSLSFYVEAVQANAAGRALFANNSPEGWNPIAMGVKPV